jgi:hypothetical protein
MALATAAFQKAEANITLEFAGRSRFQKLFDDARNQ